MAADALRQFLLILNDTYKVRLLTLPRDGGDEAALLIRERLDTIHELLSTLERDGVGPARTFLIERKQEWLRAIESWNRARAHPERGEFADGEIAFYRRLVELADDAIASLRPGKIPGGGNGYDA
ncbi:MAG: hypothetical protein KGI41_00190 [Patescibacteria group bacterium]|nr:hypothetical protein [Patescibacteria group bacterium]